MNSTNPTPSLSKEACVFLRSPRQIDSAIAELTKKSKHMQLAVAYISCHWQSVFANYIGTVQVICWLDSTNTNPYAVEEMMENASFRVKQAHSMHAKVYLAPGIGAVVGSANLSSTALSDSDIAGQYEAAILVTDVRVLQQITDWFEKLWQSASDLKMTDLMVAKEAFDRAKLGRQAIISSSVVGPSTPPSAPSSTKTEHFLPHLSTMPVSPKTGQPLYSRGEIRDVFEIVAMRAGGATVGEIRPLAKKSVALESVTKHCRDDGKRGWRWNLYIDGVQQPVDSQTGFSLTAFNSLPSSARIQLSNFRHAKIHVDSKGRTSMY